LVHFYSYRNGPSLFLSLSIAIVDIDLSALFAGIVDVVDDVDPPALLVDSTRPCLGLKKDQSFDFLSLLMAITIPDLFLEDFHP
jgi:hypothetical protein